ncbi:MAG: response regulator, partial [Acidobacteria bacterium]|nr:response regulator [Acidobacteriota bacterium]
INIVHKHQSVLVVDDEVIVQQFVTKLLTDEGYEVEVASDGADALMSIGRKNFDLILLDVAMPTLDGIKLMEIMKVKGIIPPVIVISGMDRESLKDSGLEANTHFMQKPLEARLLLDKIREMLKN